MHVESKTSKWEKISRLCAISPTPWIPVLIILYWFFIISSAIPEKLLFNFTSVFWSMIVLSFQSLRRSDKLSTFLCCRLTFYFSVLISFLCFCIKSFNSAFDGESLKFFKLDGPSFIVSPTICGLFLSNCLRSVTTFSKCCGKLKEDGTDVFKGIQDDR